MMRRRSYVYRACLVLVVAAATAGALGSCTNYFDAYAGVDILAQRGLTIADWSVAYLLPDTGESFQYITITEVDAADVGSSGLTDGDTTPVFLLEAPNLFPDGDFEASTVGSAPSEWTDVDAAAFEVEASTGTTGVVSKSVAFETQAREYGRINLRTSLADGLESDGWYALWLDFRRGEASTELRFDYADDDSSLLGEYDQSWTISAAAGATTTPIEQFPSRAETEEEDPVLEVPNAFQVQRETEVDGSHFFYVGAPQGVEFSPQSGWFDNVRIARLDVGAHIALEVPQVEDADGNDDGLTDTYPLYAGDYVLSFLVKALPDEMVTPQSANRYRATAVVVGANGQLGTRITQEEAGWGTDSWTEVSAIVSIEDGEIGLDPPLTLMIALTDPESLTVPNYAAVGGLLIAEPALQLQQP